MKSLKKNKGITLVALVVTIIVLIILATVSISAVVGENGIIAKAKLAKNIQANSIEAEQDAMDELFQEYANAMAGEGSVGNTTNEIEPPTEPEEEEILVTSISLNKANERIGEKTTLVATIEPTNATNKSIKWTSSNENVLKVDENGIVTRVSDTARETVTITAVAQDGGNQTVTCTVEVYPLVTTVTETSHETVTTVDKLGNFVEVPGDFKIADDSSDNVKEGIIIEDGSLNQFVWVPVSNINHDGSNKIRVDEKNEVEITLGRYTFDGTYNSETEIIEGTGEVLLTDGTYQYAENYINVVTLKDYYQELNMFRESNQVFGSEGTNATAKDLAGFVDSVSTNHGYYLARYEASYASGSTFGVGNNSTYYKPASKVSTAKSTSSMSYTKGTLWNFITQGNASKACRQMYYGNSYVESDLCNSYAWDTAIVYIQAMGNSNYANANRDTTGNSSLLNTGDTEDEVCKIFDMAANCYEWTTEHSTWVNSYSENPCTCRGGSYQNSKWGTNDRNRFIASNQWSYAETSGVYYSFRSCLYVK